MNGYINMQNTVVVPIKYSPFSVFAFKNGICPVEKYFDKIKKATLVDSTGKELLPYRYTELHILNNGLIRAIDEDKQGVVDIQGRIIIPIEYQYLGETRDGKGFIVKKNDKFGIINLKNEVLLPAAYEDLSEGGDGSLWVKEKNHWTKKR